MRSILRVFFMAFLAYIAVTNANLIMSEASMPVVDPNSPVEARRAACMDYCYKKYDERRRYEVCRGKFQSRKKYDTGQYILCIRDYNLDKKMCNLSCMLSIVGE